MYRPLGTGDVDVNAIVSVLGRRGYEGWFVLERDTILMGNRRGRAGGGRAGERRVRPVCAEPGQVGRFPGGSASQSGGGSICSGVSAGPRSRADTSAAGESGANMDSSCSSRFR